MGLRWKAGLHSWCVSRSDMVDGLLGFGIRLYTPLQKASIVIQRNESARRGSCRLLSCRNRLALVGTLDCC